MFNKFLAVGIRVNDFDKAFEFYTNILGLDVKTLDKDNKFAEVRVGDCVIALLTRETLEGMCGADCFSFNDKTSNIFAIEVNNVEESYNELKYKGVKFVQIPKVTPW